MRKSKTDIDLKGGIVMNSKINKGRFPTALIATGVLLLALFILGVRSETVRADDASESATYMVKFEGNWNGDSSMMFSSVPYPHFSNLIGAVHNEDVTLWKAGEMASAGVEALAEGGKTEALAGEIKEAGDDVKGMPIIKKQENKKGGFDAEGMVEFEVQVSKMHPLVTFLTMIAPSPDWFVGVNGLNLMEDGAWRKAYTAELFAYDAGTEEGEGFSTTNDETDPKENITSLKGKGKFSDKTEAIAMLEFTLKVPAAAPAPPASSKDDDDGCALAAEGSEKGGVFSLLLSVFGVLLIVSLRKRFTESKTH